MEGAAVMSINKGASMSIWWCDVCGEPIVSAEKAYVLWGRTGAHRSQGGVPKIVHKELSRRRVQNAREQGRLR